MVLDGSDKTDEGDEEQEHPADDDATEDADVGDEGDCTAIGGNTDQDERHQLKHRLNTGQADRGDTYISYIC